MPSPTAHHKSQRGREHKPHRTLLEHRDVAPHLQFNRFILTGYRPRRGILETLAWTLLVWHNESANVLSHAFGAVVCSYWLWTTVYASTPAGKLVVVSDAAALFCFVCSALYHALMSAMDTPGAYKALLSLDLAAVWGAQLGGALSLYSLLLPCAPTAVVTLLTLLPSAAAAVLLTCCARDVRHRAVAFALPQVLRVVVPIAVVVWAERGMPTTFWRVEWIVAHLAVELAAVVGGVLNATRYPERAWPGAFDLSVLNSHSLMHVLVTINMLAQHWLVGARSAAVDASPPLAACLASHVDNALGWLAQRS